MSPTRGNLLFVIRNSSASGMRRVIVHVLVGLLLCTCLGCRHGFYVRPRLCYHSIDQVTVRSPNTNEIFWVVRRERRKKLNRLDYGRVPLGMEEIVPPVLLTNAQHVVVVTTYTYDGFFAVHSGSKVKEYEVVGTNKFKGVNFPPIAGPPSRWR